MRDLSRTSYLVYKDAGWAEDRKNTEEVCGGAVPSSQPRALHIWRGLEAHVKILQFQDIMVYPMRSGYSVE